MYKRDLLIYQLTIQASLRRIAGLEDAATALVETHWPAVAKQQLLTKYANSHPDRSRLSQRLSQAIYISIPKMVVTNDTSIFICWSLTCSDLVHFCWRRRDTSIDDPELDLVMVPTDGTFVPFETDSSQSTTKTNGRVFVLKFGSSSQRHFFWLQSKPQGRTGNPSYFSPRDRKIGDIVNRLLQGEEVNVTRELNNLQNPHNRDDDDDEAMEDVEGHGHAESRPRQGSGGAGPGATGGDVREEGEESREGGSDGARAVSSGPDASAAVRNFLDSLKGQQGLSSAGSQQQSDIPYPYLNHLLPTSTTIPMIDAAEPEYVDSLLSYLPPSVLVMAANPSEAVDTKNEPGAAAIEDAKASMSLDDKRSLLKKVLRSPQLHQALG
ncbi:hypothetical protein Golomagni_07198, partial [Golovinomyces magnicellulatus]